MLDKFPYDVLYCLIFVIAQVSASDSLQQCLERISGFKSLIRTSATINDIWGTIRRNEVLLKKIAMGMLGECFDLAMKLAAIEKGMSNQDADDAKGLSHAEFERMISVHILFLKLARSGRLRFRSSMNQQKLCKAIYVYALHGCDFGDNDSPGNVFAKTQHCKQEYANFLERIYDFFNDWKEEIVDCSHSLSSDEALFVNFEIFNFYNDVLGGTGRPDWYTLVSLMKVGEDNAAAKLSRPMLWNGDQKGSMERIRILNRWALRQTRPHSHNIRDIMTKLLAGARNRNTQERKSMRVFEASRYGPPTYLHTVYFSSREGFRLH